MRDCKTHITSVDVFIYGLYFSIVRHVTNLQVAKADRQSTVEFLVTAARNSINIIEGFVGKH